jgi:hypothetical protein
MVHWPTGRIMAVKVREPDNFQQWIKNRKNMEKIDKIVIISNKNVWKSVKRGRNG